MDVSNFSLAGEIAMLRTANKVIPVGVLVVIALVSTAAFAAEKAPEITTDGLVLMKDTKLRAVYLRPGATLDQYTKVVLLDCYVAFKKNWERDHNRNAMSLGRRVSTDDMEKIKRIVADEFRSVFTQELQDKGGYEIVDKAGEDVLIVRPAIINLDVTAPDTRSAGMSRTAVASAGQMTLYMELFDSSTGDIIARVIDPEADDRGGFAMPANRSTNTAEARRIMRKWADTLRSHLGDLGVAAQAQ